MAAVLTTTVRFSSYPASALIPLRFGCGELRLRDFGGFLPDGQLWLASVGLLDYFLAELGKLIAEPLELRWAGFGRHHDEPGSECEERHKTSCHRSSYLMFRSTGARYT